MTASKQSGLSERLAQRLNAKKNPGTPEATPWPEVIGQEEATPVAEAAPVLTSVAQESEAPSPTPVNPVPLEQTVLAPSQPDPEMTPARVSTQSSAIFQHSRMAPSHLASWTDRHLPGVLALLALLVFPTLWKALTKMGTLSLLTLGFVLGLAAGLILASRYYRTSRSRGRVET